MSTSIYIDALLEQYLDLLDQYTTLRTELNNIQASVYQHISRANFSAERGIRYGKDFYDERMQASTILEISASSSDELHTFSVIRNTSASHSESPRQPKEDARSNETVQQDPKLRQGEDTKPPSAEKGHSTGNNKTPLDDLNGEELQNINTLEKGIQDLNLKAKEGPVNDEKAPSAHEEDERSSPAEDEKGKEIKPFKTPLSWFGILTPGGQSLRAAQAASTSMLTSIIPQIATVDREMKELEIRIRRARKFRAKADAEILKHEERLTGIETR